MTLEERLRMVSRYGVVSVEVAMGIFNRMTGDSWRIVANTSEHSFRIGQIVRKATEAEVVGAGFDDVGNVYTTDGTTVNTWYCAEEDVEAIV